MVTNDDGPPYPNPVQFDTVLAQQAAQELRDAARQLQTLWSNDQQLGQRALRNWTGPHADRFRPKFDSMKKTAGQLVSDMLTWAQRLEDAAQHAGSIQHSQDLANARWYREHPGSRQPVRGAF